MPDSTPSHPGRHFRPLVAGAAAGIAGLLILLAAYGPLGTFASDTLARHYLENTPEKREQRAREAAHDRAGQQARAAVEGHFGTRQQLSFLRNSGSLIVEHEGDSVRVEYIVGQPASREEVLAWRERHGSDGVEYLNSRERISVLQSEPDSPAYYSALGWFRSGEHLHSLRLQIGHLSRDDREMALAVLAHVLDAIEPELGLSYAAEIE